MNKPLIYLSGPITDCSYDGCIAWRQLAYNLLHTEFDLLDPMRVKSFLANEEVVRFHPSHGDIHPLSSLVGISTRDNLDCQRCDAMLLYLDSSPESQQSIGSMIEFGWVTARNKPVILVDNRTNNIYEHPLVKLRVIRVADLAAASDVLRGIFLPIPSGFLEKPRLKNIYSCADRYEFTPPAVFSNPANKESTLVK